MLGHMGTDFTPFEPGTTVLDRYRVVRKLGKGGMGSVYLCDDLRLAVPVALKFMDGALLADARFVDQLLTETRLARRVTHPNVCRVHDVGEVGGVPFLSMEYIDGEDLKSLLRRIGRMPADKALQIARQLCLGLFAAHEHGVLHRDLKPQNIMVDGDGDVRITDFGIAIERDRSVDGTTVLGTPAYLAPEVLGGAAPSVKSDLYSLGLVLHEVFTGRRVFEGTSMTELVDARSRAPRPPSDYVRDLDRDVERAILACLEPDPVRRPESAMDVLAALPGHDPLALALAAGDTPSPAMIAAAGARGAIPPRVAAAFVLALVVGVCGIVWIAPGVRLVDRFVAPLPEDVLVDRSRELMRALGADVDALVDGDEASGFTADVEQTRPERVLEFFHRRADAGRVLEPSDVKARASFSDPPLETTGGIATRLDVHGHLREWIVAAHVAPLLRETTDADATLWRAAALDRAAFAPATDRSPPPVFADTVRAFTGDDAGESWHVTIATLGGRPVWFRARPALEPSPSPPEHAPWKGVAQLALIGLALAISLHDAPQARRHRRSTARRRRGVRGGGGVHAVPRRPWRRLRGHRSPRRARHDARSRRRRVARAAVLRDRDVRASDVAAHRRRLDAHADGAFRGPRRRPRSVGRCGSGSPRRVRAVRRHDDRARAFVDDRGAVVRATRRRGSAVRRRSLDRCLARAVRRPRARGVQVVLHAGAAARRPAAHVARRGRRRRGVVDRVDAAVARARAFVVARGRGAVPHHDRTACVRARALRIARHGGVVRRDGNLVVVPARDRSRPLERERPGVRAGPARGHGRVRLPHRDTRRGALARVIHGLMSHRVSHADRASSSAGLSTSRTRAASTSRPASIESVG
ncbi:MAG: serine/threonine protein kinase [Planctomycetes bacterium]|nr:serine/threonine protein kinase [Planctomycetota bacterium]